MKKIIMITSLITLSSCGNNAPKCDDSEVTKMVISLLSENSRSLIDVHGDTRSVIVVPGKAKIKNIMTTSTDSELNSCGCEGIIETGAPVYPHKGSVDYFAQKNSDGDIIVKVNNAGPFKRY